MPASCKVLWADLNDFRFRNPTDFRSWETIANDARLPTSTVYKAKERLELEKLVRENNRGDNSSIKVVLNPDTGLPDPIDVKKDFTLVIPGITKRYGPTKSLIYGWVAQHQWGGYLGVKPKYATIAKDLGMDRKTVREGIEYFVKKNLMYFDDNGFLFLLID